MASVECVSTIACIEFPSEVPCSIDLIEPVAVVDGESIEVAMKLKSGETYDLRFLYKVGVPGADTFHLFFYATYAAVQDVMQNGVDPMAHQVTLNPPIRYAFQPEAPLPDATGIFDREGDLRIVMPDMAADAYYAILGMSHP